MGNILSIMAAILIGNMAGILIGKILIYIFFNER